MKKTLVKRMFTKIARFSLISIILAIFFSSIFPMETNAQDDDNSGLYATFTYYPRRPKVEENITFNASQSVGNGLEYKWDFGDGTFGNGTTVTHAYRESGSYLVLLIIQDSAGEVDVDLDRIYVRSIHHDDPLTVLFVAIYISVYLTIIGTVCFGYLINPIIGGILGYKGYVRASNQNQMKIAIPFLLTIAIAGLVGIFMVYLTPISIIIHIVCYMILKKKLDKAMLNSPNDV